MSMTKAEKAALEEAHVRAALAWPTFERPTPLTIEEIKAEVRENPVAVQTSYGGNASAGAFWAPNHHSGTISRVYCDGYFITYESRVGRSRWERLPLYRTHKDARRALAWETARQCAANLRAIEMLEESAP